MLIFNRFWGRVRVESEDWTILPGVHVDRWALGKWRVAGGKPVRRWKAVAYKIYSVTTSVPLTLGSCFLQRHVNGELVKGLRALCPVAQGCTGVTLNKQAWGQD